MNVAQVWNNAAGLFMGRAAIHYRDEPVGMNWLMAESLRFEALLDRSGCKPLDRVVLLANNKPEWLACYFAVMARGATLVPLNPALTQSEINYIIQDCKPAMAFVDGDLVELLSDHRAAFPFFMLPGAEEKLSDWSDLHTPVTATLGLADVAPEHPGIIFYTSGTTGKPKGAVLSQGATLSTISRTSSWLKSTSEDCALVAGPLPFVMHSSIAAIGHLAIGAPIVLMRRFHPREATEAIAKYRATIVFWVPTMYVMVLEFAQTQDVDISSLRVCVSGGSSLPWPVAERFEQVFGKPVLSGWGMTEGTPVTGFDVTGRGRPDSIGKALDGCDLRVADSEGNELPIGEVGELIYKSPSNMLGYFNNPEETAKTLRDGWIWTGDLGWQDAEGFFYIAGRTKDMIIRGGANIYPAEIESTLSAHEDVAETAVIGVPDPRYGESVMAMVRPSPGRHPDPAALIAYCKERLSSYKVPSEITLVEDFPRGPTGKVLKRVMREQLQAKTG